MNLKQQDSRLDRVNNYATTARQRKQVGAMAGPSPSPGSAAARPEPLNLAPGRERKTTSKQDE